VAKVAGRARAWRSTATLDLIADVALDLVSSKRPPNVPAVSLLRGAPELLRGARLGKRSPNRHEPCAGIRWIRRESAGRSLTRGS